MLTRVTLFLVAALGAQVLLAAALRDARPRLDLLPPVPSASELGLAAFGDRQFLYRQLAMDLQNFGDTGGRVTPIKNFDMQLLTDWLRALDTLDGAAQHHVLLAARYFGQTQDKPKLIHLVRYLQERVAHDPERSLPWIIDAIYLATRLGNQALVLELADQLGSYDFPSMTTLAYQLPAVLYEQAGDHQKARTYMERALRLTEKEASEQDKAFMEDFLRRVRGTR